MADEPNGRKNLEAIRKRVHELGRKLEDLSDEVATLDDLWALPQFQEGYGLLADAAVPVSMANSILRKGRWAAGCIALAALEYRDDAPSGLTGTALQQLSNAGGLYACALLSYLGRAASRPVLVPALAACDTDWLEEPVADALLAFVRARLAAGEGLEQEALAAGLQAADEPILVQLFERLGDDLPVASREAFERWRSTLVDWEFLREFAVPLDLSAVPPPEPIGDRAAAVEAVVECLTARRPVVLVGERGVGKTRIVREALRRLAADGWAAFEAQASDVHAGQHYIGMLEGRVQEIARRVSGRLLAWFLPELEEALWAGQHSRSDRGLLDALLPYAERGEVPLVAETEPRAWDLLLRHRPKLATVFHVVRLTPLDDDDAVAVARAWARDTGVALSGQVLEETLELAQHYLAGTAAPGGLLRLLELAAKLTEGGPVATSDVHEALSASTGLPLHVLDPHAPLDLELVRAFFAERILGQPEAVDCLVERIALVKAGLTDPTRPLGVFLFVGPTGTGKTEIAKALAEYLFGSPDRMIRLDMSEFQTPDSFDRLLADSTVTDHGASLISSVRAQPFSVVLLDEFEKAHENIWNVFLALFDDGRLTDQSGRTVDFRHCVLILTSNVGSAIVSGPAFGFSGDHAAFAPTTVARAVTQAFRPELLNRFDRVVVFRPLTRDQMRKLLDLELRRVLGRRGFRMHPWAVEWDEAAIEVLLDRGFSPQLGARPLKRAIEQHLLAPLARAIVQRQVPEGDQFLFVSAGNGRIEVTFVDPNAPSAPDDELADLADGVADGVRGLVLGARGDPTEVDVLSAELERVRRRIEGDGWLDAKERLLQATFAPGFWEQDDRRELLGRIEYLDRLEEATRTASSLRERLRASGGSRRLATLLAERLHVLDCALDGLDEGVAADALVGLRPAIGDGEPGRAFAETLAGMYGEWGRRRGMTVTRLEDGADAIRLGVSGLGAYTILAPEAGLHLLEHASGEGRSERVSVLVTVEPVPWGSDGPVAEPRSGGAPAVVRRYRDEPSPLVRDGVRGWRTGRLDRVLAGDFDVL